jgi:hypothetical protein
MARWQPWLPWCVGMVRIFHQIFHNKSCWVSAANELDPVLGKKLLLLLLLQHHHTSV